MDSKSKSSLRLIFEMNFLNRERRVLLGSCLIVLLLVQVNCATRSKPTGWDIPRVIRRDQKTMVSDEKGFRKARYSRPSLRPEIQSACLSWPLDRNKMNSRFGKRWRKRHKGIDLLAVEGTPVLAALPGKVIYSDDLIRGYGNMIVIKHARELYTVYAHNKENQVKRGDWVTFGQRIALSGQSGNATGPHLHFEVRDGLEPINPYQMLPSFTRKRSEQTSYCRE